MTYVDEKELQSASDPEDCEPCLRAMLGEQVKADMSCASCVDRLLYAIANRTARYVRNRKQCGSVDFSFVPPQQLDMHERLSNWGRSCNGGTTDDTAPMFQQFQSNNAAAGGYARDIKVPVDRSDATLIGRGVYYLPQPHMIAVQWYYVKRTSIMQGRRALGCTAEALARYVIDARTMLINRGV